MNGSSRKVRACSRWDSRWDSRKKVKSQLKQLENENEWNEFENELGFYVWEFVQRMSQANVWLYLFGVIAAVAPLPWSCLALWKEQHATGFPIFQEETVRKLRKLEKKWTFSEFTACLALEFSTSRLWPLFLQVLSCYCRCFWLHLIWGDCRWSQWRFFGRFQYFNSSLECLSDANCQKHRNTSNIRLSLPSVIACPTALDSQGRRCVPRNQGSSV